MLRKFALLFGIVVILGGMLMACSGSNATPAPAAADAAATNAAGVLTQIAGGAQTLPSATPEGQPQAVGTVPAAINTIIAPVNTEMPLATPTLEMSLLPSVTPLPQGLRPEDVTFIGHRNHNEGAPGILDVYHITALPLYCPSVEQMDKVGDQPLGYECASYFFGSFPEQKMREAMAMHGIKEGHIIINDAGASFLMDWEKMTPEGVEFFHNLLGAWAEPNIVGLCTNGNQSLGTMSMDGSNWEDGTFVHPVFVQIYPPGQYIFARAKDRVPCPEPQ
jgi:hypothetical protein